MESSSSSKAPTWELFVRTDNDKLGLEESGITRRLDEEIILAGTVRDGIAPLISPRHVQGVVGHCHIPGAIYRHQTGGSTQRGAHGIEQFISYRLYLAPANDRGIADPSDSFPRYATGRGRRRNVSVRINRHGPHGSTFTRSVALVGRLPIVQRVLRVLRDQLARRFQVPETPFNGEPGRSVASVEETIGFHDTYRLLDRFQHRTIASEGLVANLGRQRNTTKFSGNAIFRDRPGTTISTLVQHRSEQQHHTSEQKMRAIGRVGQAVNLAVERFVTVGETIADDNPEIKQDMYDACKEARAAAGLE
uniref:Uncharacterized protein n=1 Tax=Anopheles dirus TaxID=7168 RepID=A0A182NSW0_9DIPT